MSADPSKLTPIHIIGNTPDAYKVAPLCYTMELQDGSKLYCINEKKRRDVWATAKKLEKELLSMDQRLDGLMRRHAT